MEIPCFHVWSLFKVSLHSLKNSSAFLCTPVLRIMKSESWFMLIGQHLSSTACRSTVVSEDKITSLWWGHIAYPSSIIKRSTTGHQQSGISSWPSWILKLRKALGGNGPQGHWDVPFQALERLDFCSLIITLGKSLPVFLQYSAQPSNQAHTIPQCSCNRKWYKCMQAKLHTYCIYANSFAVHVLWRKPIQTPVQRPTVATAPPVVASPSKLVPSGCWKLSNGQNTSKWWSHGCSAIGKKKAKQCHGGLRRLDGHPQILFDAFLGAGGSWPLLPGCIIKHRWYWFQSSMDMAILLPFGNPKYWLQYDTTPGRFQSSRHELNVSIVLGTRPSSL